MKRRFAFQKEKFLALGLKQQHKKCAEFLEEILNGSQKLDHYLEIAAWMGLPPLQNMHDRLFEHLNAAGMSFTEHRFVKTSDREDASDFLPITIYLEGLRSLHNIGSIIRTTEAFRLGSIVLSNPISTDKLQKSAMNTQEWVNVTQIDSSKSLPRPLIVLETIPTSTPYYDFAFPDSFTLAVGNEASGCSKELINDADACIHIPLFGRKNSLNVACAYAIVASEILRKKNRA